MTGLESTTEQVAFLQRASASAAAWLEAVARRGEGSAETVVVLGRIARELSEHAAQWESLLPESVLLETHRQPALDDMWLGERLAEHAESSAAAVLDVVAVEILPVLADRCRKLNDLANGQFVARGARRISADLADSLLDALIARKAAQGRPSAVP